MKLGCFFLRLPARSPGIGCTPLPGASGLPAALSSQPSFQSASGRNSP